MVQFPDAALRGATDATLKALGAPADAPRDALARYAAALAKFGAHTDLVGARTPETLVEIALADAVVLARNPALVRAPGWEVGAGGASLGVPLALWFPEFRARLVEPRQKRATFLRMAVGALGLAGRVQVEQARVDLAAPPEGVAGCALSRAVFAPETWVPLAARVVAPGGAFVVLTTDDLAAPEGFRALAVDRYELPFSRARRVATWLARAG